MLMRKLGRTGLKVSALCLGGNTFGWTTDQKASEAVLDAYCEAGGNFIEHPELVAQRLVRYAEVVGRERVIAGSDCGFATFARSRPLVEPEIVWAKLKSMTEGARLASGQLWN